MNIPSIYRKALDGFVIPPRSFFQMFVGAAKGTFALFDEDNRNDFITKLDKGIINEGVISQATAGPMVMLSLFHDLRNPLFKKYNFDPSQFLKGVGPALENYHNVSGALENELYQIALESSSQNATKEESGDSDKVDKTDSAVAGMAREEHEAILATISMLQQRDSPSVEADRASAILSHDWTKEAKENPDSMAGQLSNMLTKELFDHYQLGAKTTFLLANPSRRLKFREGSCTVNNVALLSARAFRCVEKSKNKEASSDDEGTATTSSAYEIIEYESEEGGDQQKLATGVAAQMEVLYDVTSQFDVFESSPSSLKGNERSVDSGNNDEVDVKDMETTVVSVAVLEGFLNGGPEGELRWRIALHRPAFEFPGMQQAY